MNSHDYCELCNLEGTTLFVADRLIDEENLCQRHRQLFEIKARHNDRVEFHKAFRDSVYTQVLERLENLFNEGDSDV